MDRRELLGSIAAGTSIGLAGCTSDNESDSETDTTNKLPERDSFRYFFDDQEGTLNQAGDSELPDNPAKNQIITNERTEDEWREMVLNDYNFIEHRARENTRLPLTLEELSQIEENTQNIFQEIKQTGSYENEIFEDKLDAEIFTISLLKATNETTDENLLGATQSRIVQNIADRIAETGSYDFEEYNLSGNSSMIPEGVGDLRHPLGVLIWEEEGQTHVRYAETERRNTALTAKPQNSIYGSSLNQESFDAPRLYKADPEEWVGPLDYDKLQEMEQMYEDIDSGEAGDHIAVTLMSSVDDAGGRGYDGNVPGVDSGPGVFPSIVVADEFGESVQNFARHPSENYTREEFEGTARAVYSAITEDSTNDSYALTGTLSNPSIHKVEEDTVEEIKNNRDFDKVNQNLEK